MKLSELTPTGEDDTPTEDKEEEDDQTVELEEDLCDAHDLLLQCQTHLHSVIRANKKRKRMTEQQSSEIIELLEEVDTYLQQWTFLT